jgi:gas vesicle protein
VGVVGRIGAFLAGGVIGAGVGAVVATLNAPQSGDEFQEELELLVTRAKAAGDSAQRLTEEELIRRFRAETNDPDALRDLEVQAAANPTLTNHTASG